MANRVCDDFYSSVSLEEFTYLVWVLAKGHFDVHVEDAIDEPCLASRPDQPGSIIDAQLAAVLELLDHKHVSIANITIIDILVPNRDEICCRNEGSGDIAFFIKPCKFFLYCFLAAHQLYSATLPPISGWREQLYAKHSSFNCSSPDSVAVDRCIFGMEKVFSRRSLGVKCKKKLPVFEKLRRSPRLARNL